MSSVVPSKFTVNWCRLDCDYRIDVLAENQLILRRSRYSGSPTQPLTYMKLVGVKIGLLINFNNTKLKDGIKRFVL